MSQSDIILVCIIAASVAWPFLLIWLMSYITGWRDMAARFPAQPQGDIASKGLTSLILRGVGRFNNCILWRADDTHLHLRMTPPFNLGYAPVSIPWSAVTDVYPTVGSKRFATVRCDGLTFQIGRAAVASELAAREALRSESAAIS